MLQDKHVPINTFAELKKMRPVRQIEAAQLMVALYLVDFQQEKVRCRPSAPRH